MRVLLESPLSGLDPPSGDISYTEALLESPPPDVQYIIYIDAIADGSLVVRGWHPRNGRMAVLDCLILLVRIVKVRLRNVGLMFREPYWFVSIAEGKYDLVHSHLSSVRRVGRQVPVVTGKGYPLSVLYRDRDGWGRWWIRLALSLEALFSIMLRVDVPWLRTNNRSVMTVCSEHYLRWLIQRKSNVSRIAVARTALPGLRIPEKRSEGRTIGYVGREFNRKGGLVACQVLGQLRAVDPSLHMVLVTSANETCPRDQEGIEYYFDVPRSEILKKLLPRIDIFLLITNSHCGAPFGVLETPGQLLL